MVRVQEMLVVNSKLGINDFKGFIAAAKAKPGKMTCGSAGTGGITHLAIELLKREAGIDILHVPYRGAAPATNDLLAGTVDIDAARHLGLAAAYPLRRDQGAGRDLRHALAAAARRADHARARLAQGQFRQLVRPDLARRGRRSRRARRSSTPPSRRSRARR